LIVLKCETCKKVIDVKKMNHLSIKTNEKNNSQICLECQNNLDGNVSVKDLSISKGQAKFIIKYRDYFDSSPELSTYIKENWGTLDHFKSMCFSLEPNQLSLLINFIQIKELFEQVFLKDDFDLVSKFYVRDFENEFNSWEQFLDLVGEDPWYKSSPKSLDSIVGDSTVELLDRFVKNKDALSDRVKRKIKVDLRHNSNLGVNLTDSLERLKHLQKIDKQKKKDDSSFRNKLKKAKYQEYEKERITKSLNRIYQKDFEKENTYKTDEDLLEIVIKSIEYDLRDNPETLKKFQTVVKFVDMLEFKQLEEINNSIQ